MPTEAAKRVARVWPAKFISTDAMAILIDEVLCLPEVIENLKLQMMLDAEDAVGESFASESLRLLEGE